MRDRATVLIDHEHDRQTCVQQFTLALGSRLLYGLKDFLKRHDCNDRRDNVLIVWTTQHWFCNRERHFWSGTNNLRAADDETTTIHFRQDLADARIDFIELDHILLKCAMECSIDGAQDERDNVWVVLKCLLKTQVVPGIVQGLDAARNLESAGETGDDVAVALAVELDL